MDKAFGEELAERLRSAADHNSMKMTTNFMGELRSYSTIIRIAANVIERMTTLPLEDRK